VAALLEITEREADGILILNLNGRLIAGDSANLFRDRMREELETHNRIVLNLSQVDFIDSTGLGALVICFTAARTAGGALKLVQLNQHSLELLVLTKLSTIFETFQAEQDAVNSFFPERKVQPFDILQFVRDHKAKS